jgi:hypothetical protein
MNGGSKVTSLVLLAVPVSGKNAPKSTAFKPSEEFVKDSWQSKILPSLVVISRGASIA